jgi:hypothetical protein
VDLDYSKSILEVSFMSKDNKKESPFLSITGMWKRVSTTRVGKDGKPEPYWYGKVQDGKEDIVITEGSEIMLFPSTSTNKKGGPEYFLKVRQPTESEESEEVVADAN